MSTAEQTKGAAAAVETQAADSTLDQVIAATRAETPKEEEMARDIFKNFLGQLVKPGQMIDKDVERSVKYWIAQIDQTLSAQVNEIMHHPDYQRLEGTWRGLHYLVNKSETGESLKIRVLNTSKKDLLKDLERASEFDQSWLYKKVYEEEYGTLGGKPYGMLVGDYEFSKHPEDIGLLKLVSNVAAAAHAPFVAAASPKLLNLESFADLPNPRDLAKIFATPDFAAWKAFRESEDSRYVALTMPRVLARLPYGADFRRVDAFNFEEAVDGRDHGKYQWMSAAWAYAARITDAMAKHGWMAATRGVEGGGKVEDLPVHTFKTDDGDIAMKCPTEIAISDRREFELSNLGFLPLLHCKDSTFAAFLGAQSCQKPKTYFDPAANANAELSTKLNYIMCVSRFAHYLKVMARDRIGSFMERGDCERWLNEWINNYVLETPDIAGPELKAKKPLREARVEVREVKGKPGWYEAVAFLRPHFQLETLTTSMRLVAELPKPKGG